MKGFDWIKAFFYSSKEKDEMKDLMNSNHKTIYQYMAIQTCINFIASTISLAEFQTKENGVVVKKKEYYKLNIEPNRNTGAAAFWRSVIEKLVEENECLVVKFNDSYYVAESYERTEYTLKECEYKNITLGKETPYILKEIFTESDVFFFRWHNLEILDLVRQVYHDLHQLIGASKDNYLMLSRLKVLIKRDVTLSSNPAFTEAYNDLVNKNLTRFLDPDRNGALPIAKGVEYEDVSKANPGTSNNISREMRGFINDGFDMVAMALQIPPQLLKGEVAGLGDAYRLFITSCIKPILDVISDEINRKLYGEENYTKGNKLFIDITKASYADITQLAPALEALTRIGVNTLDDSLELLGREAIGDKQRWMTKNYDKIEHFSAPDI